MNYQALKFFIASHPLGLSACFLCVHLKKTSSYPTHLSAPKTMEWLGWGPAGRRCVLPKMAKMRHLRDVSQLIETLGGGGVAWGRPLKSVCRPDVGVNLELGKRAAHA